MSTTATRLIVVLGVGLLALPLGACGSKKKKMTDPVATVLMTPGVRLVTIPRQRQDLTVVVPPCSAAQVRQDATRKPPGSNEILIPKGALTQTVAVPPCQMQTPQAPTNTVLMTPGGTGAAPSEAGMASELVVPNNSNLSTIIVSPCTTGGAKSQEGKSSAFPATSRKKTVTAPPCTAPPPMPKK